jgi:DNA-binding transcriptional regulator YhcF (GntR family)
MLLNLTDLSAEPLHSQISRQVLGKILGGDLSDGVELMSA